MRCAATNQSINVIDDVYMFCMETLGCNAILALIAKKKMLRLMRHHCYKKKMLRLMRHHCYWRQGLC